MLSVSLCVTGPSVPEMGMWVPSLQQGRNPLTGATWDWPSPPCCAPMQSLSGESCPARPGLLVTSWNGRCHQLLLGHDRALAWEDIQDVDRAEWGSSTETWQCRLVCSPWSAALYVWLAEDHFPLAPTGKAAQVTSLAPAQVTSQAGFRFLICLVSFQCLPTFSGTAAKAVLGLFVSSGSAGPGCPPHIWYQVWAACSPHHWTEVDDTVPSNFFVCLLAL